MSVKIRSISNTGLGNRITAVCGRNDITVNDFGKKSSITIEMNNLSEEGLSIEDCALGLNTTLSTLLNDLNELVAKSRTLSTAFNSLKPDED
jgi:hypothetical protein